MLGYSKRMGKWLRRRQTMSKCSRESSELNRGLISSFNRSRIQGFMSSCLALCAYLNVIDLHDNMLSGIIPQQLGLLIRLSAFDVFDAAIPFSGYKMSGQGRVRGIYSLSNYLQVMEGWACISMWQYSYTKNCRADTFLRLLCVKTIS